MYMNLGICGRGQKGQPVTQTEKKKYKLESKVWKWISPREHMLSYDLVSQCESYRHRLAGTVTVCYKCLLYKVELVFADPGILFTRHSYMRIVMIQWLKSSIKFSCILSGPVLYVQFWPFDFFLLGSSFCTLTGLLFSSSCIGQMLTHSNCVPR